MTIKQFKEKVKSFEEKKERGYSLDDFIKEFGDPSSKVSVDDGYITRMLSYTCSDGRVELRWRMGCGVEVIGEHRF